MQQNEEVKYYTMGFHVFCMHNTGALHGDYTLYIYIYMLGCWGPIKNPACFIRLLVFLVHICM